MKNNVEKEEQIWKLQKKHFDSAVSITPLSVKLDSSVSKETLELDYAVPVTFYFMQMQISKQNGKILLHFKIGAQMG